MSKLDDLLHVMARLRDPVQGCPWDIRQTFATIAPYTIEEAYEVADAIARNNIEEIKAELGDLLFQVVFQAQIAHEQSYFDFESVVEGVISKLVNRHPHVFGTTVIDGIEAQNLAWEAHKAEERKAKALAAQCTPSIFDELPVALPALMRALKLQKRAANVNFDWHDIREVLAKVEEELEELREELNKDVAVNHERISHELGDLLFACVNLARHANVDPESALRTANGRFETRFKYIESTLAKQGLTVEQCNSAQLEHLWQEAKTHE